MPITISNAIVGEGTASNDRLLVFTVSLGAAATAPVRFTWLHTPGSAVDSDLYYGSESNSLIINTGQSSGELRFYVRADSLVEADEFTVVSLFNPVGDVFSNGALRLDAIGVIQDDDGTDTKRSFFVSDAELVEGANGQRNMVFTVMLSRVSNATLAFDYRSVDGTALAGSDYVATSGSLSFTAGQTVATVSVPVLGDALVEPEEFFSLQVVPQAAALSALAAGTVARTGLGFIADDDTSALAPEVFVRSTRVIEGTTSSDYELRYEVVLSEPATSTVSVRWLHTPLSRGATTEGDLYYGSQTARLDFSAGQTTAYINVLVRADAVVEVDEGFALTLFNPIGVEFAGGALQLKSNGFVLDDDGAGEKRALLVSGAEVIEGADGARDAVFRVQLSRPAPIDLQFDFRTIDGSARAGSDYASTSGVLTLVAGQTMAAVRVPVAGDTDIESEEFFNLLVTPQPASLASIANGTEGRIGLGFISDDDASPTLPEISVRSASQAELTSSSDAYLRYEVVLSEVPTSTVRVSWLHTTGGSGSETDLYYGSQGTTLTFTAGQTMAYIDVLLRADALVEVDESFTLVLYNPSGAVFAGGVDRLKTMGVALDDDGSSDKRSLFVGDAEVVEGAAGTRQAVFRVQLSRPAATDLVFDYRTLDASAQAGSDYVGASGSLTFAAGQTDASVSVSINGDAELEADEIFTLLVTPQAAALPFIVNGVDGRAGQGLISDDDASATLAEVSVRGVSQIELTSSSDAYLRYELVLSEVPTSTVSLRWLHTPGGTGIESDLYYGTQGASLSFAAGQTTAFIDVLLRADNLVEPDEVFTLELYGLTGAVFAGGVERLRSTGFVLDDDGTAEKRALFVSDAEMLEGQAGSKEAVFRVQLSRPSATELVFDYRTLDGSARAGSDFVATSGSLVFAPGQTEAAVRVVVNGDDVLEADEVFSLLVTPQAASVSAIANGVDGRAGMGFIADDDSSASLPEMSVRSSSQVEYTSSSDAYLRYEVMLSEAPTSTVVVRWLHSPNATGIESDLYYGTQGGTLSFAAGQTTGFVEILLRADNLVEPDEVFILELYNLSGAVFAGGGDRLSTTGFVMDDDGTAEKRALFVSDAQLLEGAAGTKEAVFRVQLSRPAPTELRLDYTTLDGSAQAGSDFVATTGILVFAAGQTEASISVVVNGDTAVEADELFTLLVTPQAGSAAAIANGVDGRAGQGLIADDDASATLPEVSVRSSPQIEYTSSSDAYLRYQVVLTEAPTSAVTMRWSHVTGGTASESDLYYGVQGATLSFAAGQTTAYIEILIRADNLVEPDEAFTLDLWNLSGAVFAGGVDRLRTTGFVFDDDGTAEKRALFVSDAEVVEGASGTREAVFRVQLSRPAPVALSFDYRTIDSTATAGADYTSSSGVLTLAAGQTEAAVRIPVLGDTTAEGHERFTLLVTPQAAALASIGNGVDGRAGIGIIEDDDSALPSIGVSVIANAEGSSGAGGTAYYRFELSEPATSRISVSYMVLAGTTATVGTASLSDIAQFPAGVLNFEPGQTTAWIDVPLVADALAEPDENLQLTLFNPSGAVFAGGAQRLTLPAFILDDDGSGEKRALLVESVELLEGQADTQQAVFKVQLSRPSSATLVFDYRTIDGSAQAGSDYVASSGALSFAPGQTEAAVFVTINGDRLREAEEFFTLLVTPQSGSAAALGSGADGRQGLAFIGDDDSSSTLPVVQMRGARTEESSSGSINYVFTLSLSRASSEAVQVPYRIVNGSTVAADFVSSTPGVVTFAPGQTTQTVGVRVNPDTTPEPDEYFFVETFNPIGAVFADGAEVLRATGVIQDDDGTGSKRILIVSSATALEGDSGTSSMAFVVQLSRPATTELAFDYQTLAGTASAGADFTATTGRLVFAPGQTEAAVLVPIVGDTLQEVDETLRLSFAANALVANGTAAIEATGTILANDYAPVRANVGDNASINEGTTFTRRVNITDGLDSGSSGWTWRVVWSDGVVANGTTPLASPFFDITRAFADNIVAPLEAVVTVTDSGLDADEQRLRLDVVNVAPTLNATGATSVLPGGTWRLSLSATDPAGVNDPLVYSINWDDGSAPQSLTAAQLQQAFGQVSHVFEGQAGASVTRNVTVSVNDGDGGLTTRVLPVNVGAASQTFTGGPGRDVFTPLDSGDRYIAGDGNDLINPGAGADTVDGGDGSDIISYAGLQPVTVNLGTGIATHAGATDNINNIEAVFGSSAGDTIRGTDLPDNQRDDTIRGGGGNDTIDGATGNDTAEWLGPRANYTVTRNTGTGVVTVRDNVLTDGDEGTDTLTSIERLVFADKLVGFGQRAEEVARVAFVLWSPDIVGSSSLFARGLSFYDVGYSFDIMCSVALQFWPQTGLEFATIVHTNTRGTTRSVADVMAIMNNAGGGDAGRAAAVAAMAMDAATTNQLNAKGVYTAGVVADLVVPGFGQLFELLPG